MSNTPSTEEVNFIFYKLRSSYVSQLDGIPDEILKTSGDYTSYKIHSLITRLWNESSVSKKEINVILISIYKGEDLKSACGNSSGMTLLEHTGEILSKIMFDRLINNVCLHVMPEEQKQWA